MLDQDRLDEEVYGCHGALPTRYTADHELQSPKSKNPDHLPIA